MNVWDVVIVAAVALIVFFAVRSYKRHGRSCCNNCEKCNKNRNCCS